jgi:acyl carrier protein
MEMRSRVFWIFSQIMGIPEDQISDNSSPETIGAWDSLRHMRLVLALEEEFGIKFSDETIVQMLSVGAVIAAVAKLLPGAEVLAKR